VDETKLKIKGKWYYLYRAVDGLGNLVDLRLSKVRDLESTEAFFKQAVATTRRKPEKVTTDKEVSYPKVIRKVLGEKVEHRTNQHLNNPLEQDHRGIKQRYRVMLNFKSARNADQFCQAFDEQRQFFRFRLYKNQEVSNHSRKWHFRRQFYELRNIFKKFTITNKNSATVMQI